MLTARRVTRDNAMSGAGSGVCGTDCAIEDWMDGLKDSDAVYSFAAGCRSYEMDLSDFGTADRAVWLFLGRAQDGTGWLRCVYQTRCTDAITRDCTVAGCLCLTLLCRVSRQSPDVGQ